MAQIDQLRELYQILNFGKLREEALRNFFRYFESFTNQGVDIEVTYKEEWGKRLDLSNLDLSGKEFNPLFEELGYFENVNLRGTNLGNRDLSEFNFTRCDLGVGSSHRNDDGTLTTRHDGIIFGSMYECNMSGYIGDLKFKDGEDIEFTVDSTMSSSKAAPPINKFRDHKLHDDAPIWLKQAVDLANETKGVSASLGMSDIRDGRGYARVYLNGSGAGEYSGSYDVYACDREGVAFEGEDRKVVSGSVNPKQTEADIETAAATPAEKGADKSRVHG